MWAKTRTKTIELRRQAGTHVRKRVTETKREPEREKEPHIVGHVNILFQG